MQHLGDLNKLIKEKEKIDEFLVRIESVMYLGGYENGEYIAFSKDDNKRWTFNGLSGILTKEKMLERLEVFVSLIKQDLQEVKEQKEREISEYTIIKE